MAAAHAEYLTVEQAAKELDTPARTIRERVRRGLMAGTKVNPRLVLIPRSEVDAWQGRRRVRSRRGVPPGFITVNGEGITPLMAQMDAFRAQFPEGYLFPCAADVLREIRDEQDERQ